jgi:hypothetical protein
MAIQAPSNYTPLHMSRHFDYKNASMNTVESWAAVTMEFLQICLLLTHTSPNISLFNPINRCPVDPSFNIFPH